MPQDLTLTLVPGLAKIHVHQAVGHTAGEGCSESVSVKHFLELEEVEMVCPPALQLGSFLSFEHWSPHLIYLCVTPAVGVTGIKFN